MWTRTSDLPRGALPLLAIALHACTPAAPELAFLPPVPRAFGPDDPLWAPQPRRDKPTAVVASADGTKAWVALSGTPAEPGSAVAVVLPGSTEPPRRIPVGSLPTGLALHPSGRWLVVTHALSNWISVVDTAADAVAGVLPCDFYATGAAFSPDGTRLYVANRWRDALATWAVAADEEGLSVVERSEPGIPVGVNPRDVAVSEGGGLVAVASPGALSVSLIDAAAGQEIARVDVGAPPNGIAFAGEFLVVATLSRSTHHGADDGPDGDGDGQPGDGTPGVGFQDLQNEIAVYRLPSGEEAWRYTSDTLCCRDYGDVDPADAARGGDRLPPRERWIVGGALPEQVVAVQEGEGHRVYVTYSASDQVQSFAVDPATGALAPGPIASTAGHAPHGLAVAGGRLLVAERLSETLGVHDAATLVHAATVVVGDVSGGTFPSTDAEIGELVATVTAPFTVDGDVSCMHCHREGGQVDKAFAVPWARRPTLSTRTTPPFGDAAATRPWFFEANLDESNFRPELYEFARSANFCCEDESLWPDGPPARCGEDPPAECATAPGPSSLDGFAPARGGDRAPYQHPWPTAAATRDRFFLDASAAVLGRTSSFGDALTEQHGTAATPWPIALDVAGISRALGLFLLEESALLPNPQDPDSGAARRGRLLFESGTVGCSFCHGLPDASGVEAAVDSLPPRLGPVVSPDRAEDGTNLDLLGETFLTWFPDAEQDACEDVCSPESCALDPDACDDLRNVRLGVPSLRGLWDRTPRFLHDGRARSLREVLCTPGHPALLPGEIGFNERDGIPDTHGGTSQLSPTEIEDLVAFLLTL